MDDELEEGGVGMPVPEDDEMKKAFLGEEDVEEDEDEDEDDELGAAGMHIEGEEEDGTAL